MMDIENIRSYLGYVRNLMQEGKFILAYKELDFVIQNIQENTQSPNKSDMSLRQVPIESGQAGSDTNNSTKQETKSEILKDYGSFKNNCKHYNQVYDKKKECYVCEDCGCVISVVEDRGKF